LFFLKTSRLVLRLLQVSIIGWLNSIFTKTKKGKSTTRGHCYVEESEFTTKKEKQDILEDTKRYRFTYRNKKYTLQ